MANTPSALVDLGTPTAVAEIAELARRAAYTQPQPYPLNGDLDTSRSLILIKRRDDERIDTLDLERHLNEPTRARGAVEVHNPDDFVAYTNRLANPEHTSVWANLDAGTLTAVINDHADWDQPGWRDHTITLRLQPDEDWQRWMSSNGKGLTQAAFAEFLEDVAHTVVRPEYATIAEVARTMSGKRQVEFRQGTSLPTGDLQLRYEETTTARAGQKGELEVPEQIVVQLAPWRGVIVAELEARLRYRIEDGRLLIGYKLLRPDVFRAEVFDGLVERIRGDLEVDALYRGVAPATHRS